MATDQFPLKRANDQGYSGKYNNRKCLKTNHLGQNASQSLIFMSLAKWHLTRWSSEVAMVTICSKAMLKSCVAVVVRVASIHQINNFLA